MQTQSIKEQACRLLDNLPDTATWDDVMYRCNGTIRIRTKSCKEGNTTLRITGVQELTKQFPCFFFLTD